MTMDPKTGAVARPHPEPLPRFAGEVALVTGGSSPLGAAIAARLAIAGAIVVFGDTRYEMGWASAGDAVPDHAGSVVAHGLDVADPLSRAGVLTAVRDRFGRLDMLINAAATGLRGRFGAGHGLEDWERMAAVNLAAPYHMSVLAAELLTAAKGRIVNVALADSVAALPDASLFAASKGGVVQLTRALACEFGPRGVRANAVAPFGPLAGLDDAESATPGAAEPGDVADAVYFLCSPLSRYVNGVSLPVGGLALA